MSDPREMTVDEVREKFLSQAWALVEYWNQQPQTKRDCLVGLLHSIFVILDGESVIPGFLVAPRPHPDDKEYNRLNGHNWYPDNSETNVLCDIAGSLHDAMWFVK